MSFPRKYLSADGLMTTVKHCFYREKFEGYENSPYSWSDCLMSGLAIFGFKMPSLLQFEKKKVEDELIKRNLKALYGVDKAPSIVREGGVNRLFILFRPCLYFFPTLIE